MTTSNRPTLAQPGQQVAAPNDRRPLEAYLASPKVVDGIKAVAGKYLSPDRMLRIVTFALRKTPKLADCDPQSFLGSVMTSAALGLEPNTPQGHAYLIPYDKRGRLPDGSWGVIGTECQFIIGYRGFIELAYRNPNIVKFIAKPIYANDFFDHMEGSESFLKFKPALKDRGELIGAFAYAKYRTEHGAEAEMAVVLPVEEVYKARSKSETYNFLLANIDRAQNQKARDAAIKKFNETPWVMWEGDMAAKTALRKLAKVVPLGDAFGAAAAIEERSNSSTLDLTAMADPHIAKAIVDGEIDAPAILEHHDEEEFAMTGGVDGTISREAAETVPARKRATKPKETTVATVEDKETTATVEPKQEQVLDNRRPIAEKPIDERPEPPPSMGEWEGD